MLEITLCLEEKVLAEYCRQCGRLPGPAFYLYQARDRDKLLAAALFQVGSDQVDVLLYDSQEDDVFLFDAMLRAGLNYAGDQGISHGCLPEAFRQEHGAYFKTLNYPAQAIFNITNFFQKYKRCIL